MKLSKLTIFSWILTLIMPIVYSIFVKKMELAESSLGVKQLENSMDAVTKLETYNSIENVLMGVIIGLIILSVVLTIVDLIKSKKQ